MTRGTSMMIKQCVECHFLYSKPHFQSFITVVTFSSAVEIKLAFCFSAWLKLFQLLL